MTFFPDPSAHTDLPPIQAMDTLEDKGRQFRTALPSSAYLELEKESLQRGLKPYTLSSRIITLYLQKKLILISDLPTPLQDQIYQYIRKPSV